MLRCKASSREVKKSGSLEVENFFIQAFWLLILQLPLNQKVPAMTESNANPIFRIKSQYVKDLSFENPHSPNSLTTPEANPAINVNVGLKAQRLNDDHFEMIINITANAKGEIGTLFIAELDYAAIIQLSNVPEDKIELMLFIDCAFLLFPFARRVLADITRDGGFPPMLLDPIDFVALYQHNKQLQAAEVTSAVV